MSCERERRGRDVRSAGDCAGTGVVEQSSGLGGGARGDGRPGGEIDGAAGAGSGRVGGRLGRADFGLPVHLWLALPEIVAGVPAIRSSAIGIRNWAIPGGSSRAFKRGILFFIWAGVDPAVFQRVVQFLGRVVFDLVGRFVVGRADGFLGPGAVELRFHGGGLRAGAGADDVEY